MFGWTDNNEDQWVTNNDAQWYPYDEGVIVYPVKNWISKAQFPYYFLAEDYEHIFEGITSNYLFQANNNVYNFVAKDDKYLNKT